MKNKKLTKPAAQIHVGVFRLGHLNVDLYALTNEQSGYFYWRPDEKSLPRIKIGIDTRYWDQVVSVLIHEAFEFDSSRIRARYTVSGVEGDHASYAFFFNHAEFVDICESVATFVAAALPKLQEEHKKLSKSKGWR